MNEKAKILVVEDDNDLVAALLKILENKGYTATSAYDPEEGWDRLIRDKPDLIILDVMFGGKGESRGFDFAQKLRYDRQFSDIPILMMTAINAEKPFFKFSADSDGEFLPVDAFLDKPVDTDELLLKIEILLKQKTSKWRNWPNKEK
jgi:DNA-binding response OmpR family regulator